MFSRQAIFVASGTLNFNSETDIPENPTNVLFPFFVMCLFTHNIVGSVLQHSSDLYRKFLRSGYPKNSDSYLFSLI